MPRVFVGTMCSGEGDFTFACDAIASQKDVEIEHIVINGLPELEAHNKLWSSWNSVKCSNYDFFVKVDADTVLAHDHVFIDLWTMLQSNKRITGIQSPLHDYYTNEFINGLNCFDPRVVLRESRNDLYCDRQVDFNHDIVIRANGVCDSLKPAGYHCHHANPLQSFHFGLHRMLKNQHEIIEKVKKNWKGERLSSDRYLDSNRSYALLGAIVAGQLSRSRKFNYTDKELLQLFDSSVDNNVQLLGML